MRSMIMMGCLWMLSIAGYSQSSNGRSRSGTQLRWGRNDTKEVLDGDLVQRYGRADTSLANKLSPTISTALGGNPHATRFTSAQAVCDQNSVHFNWTAIQQPSNADRYEIEQSADGGDNWTMIGLMPASRTSMDESSYNFDYNKSPGNVIFRIAAINIAGEKIYSSVIYSPCSNTSYLAVTPNPVLSTTTVRIGSPAAAKVKLVLVNQGGVIMQTREAGLLQGNNQLPLDMSSLPKGFYTLSIVWNGGRQDSFKLVKQ